MELGSQHPKVRYERRNERGEIVMAVEAFVINVNRRTQQVQLYVSPRLRFWVSVTSVSLVKNGAANVAAVAA